MENNDDSTNSTDDPRRSVDEGGGRSDAAGGTARSADSRSISQVGSADDESFGRFEGETEEEVEKQYDANEGKWKARVKKDRALSTQPVSDGFVEDGDSPEDELVREISRLRRKLLLQQQAEKPGDDMEQDDVEIGFGPVDSIVATEPVDGRWDVTRPGAFRVSGTDEDGEFNSDDRVPLPQPPLEPSTVASRRPEPVLLEANLVVEQEEGTEALLVKAETKLLKLVALTDFVLGGSALVGGTILRELPRPTNLVQLDLFNSTLSGTIPTELGTMVDLAYLPLNDNPLIGTIPMELGRMETLKTLRVSNTSLSGTIPAELGLLTEVDEFERFNTALTRSIPTEFGQLTNLENLLISNTSLSGTIPGERSVDEPRGPPDFEHEIVRDDPRGARSVDKPRGPPDF
jgi:hypothetical protein